MKKLLSIFLIFIFILHKQRGESNEKQRASCGAVKGA